MDRAAELAYLEGIRALDEQRSSLDAAQSRVTTALGLSSVGTAFLAPAALDGHDGMPWLGWFAIALLLATVAAAVIVLWPGKEWTWSNEPEVLASDEWLGRAADEVNVELAKKLGSHLRSNAQPLRRRWMWVRASLCCATASIVAWTLLLGTTR
jgi:hypothetical protein